MGLCMCKCGDNMPSDDDIESHMKQEREMEKKKYKLLLLGAGSSGKSTLLRQIKYLYVYNNDFPDSDKKQVRDVIYANIIDIFRVLCYQCKILNIEHDITNIEYTKNFIVSDADTELYFDETSSIFKPNIKQALLKLSTDKGILECYNQRHKFTLLDNSGHFIKNIERMLKDDYIPEFKDAICSRSMTTGLTKEEFIFERKDKKKEYYEIIDVGGQRSERTKWIQGFDNVICVLFVIALSGYNQTLFEDHNVNRLREGINLFESTLKIDALKKAHFVLFMNKRDLFEEKIKQVPFTVCFNENEYNRDPYDGSEVIEWLRSKLTIRDDGRVVYFHVTCAAETDEVDRLFGYVHDIVIRKAFQGSGFV